MILSVEKQNERFVAIISDCLVVDSCIVKNSWNSHIQNVDLKQNLFAHDWNLYEDNDLSIFSFPLEKITDVQNFYEIIVESNGLTYSFFVDYTYFVDYRYEPHIYYYNIPDNMKPLDLDTSKYSFYIVGNYTDKYKVKIEEIKNNRFITFKIPDKNLLESEFYYFEITERVAGDEKRFLKDTIGIETKKGAQFLYSLEDYGRYYKCDVFSKYPYKFLKEVKVNGNLVPVESNIIGEKYSKHKITLFLTKSDYTKDIELFIEYKVQEDYLGAITIDKNTLLTFENKEKKEYKITNFETYYDFKHDTMYLTWQNSFPNVIRYKLILHAEDQRYVGDYSDGTSVFYTKEQVFKISEFVNFNQQQDFLKLEIHASVNNVYIPLMQDISFDNPFVKFKSSPCEVVIENEDFLKTDKLSGLITWSGAKFPHYSKIKIEADFIHQFLNEFTEPWKTEEDLILHKTVADFSKAYPNLEDEIEYDFTEKGVLRGKPKDAFCSFLGLEQDFVRIEEDRYLVPKWYTKKNSPYRITVQIYDLWDRLCGENTISFTNEIKSIPFQTKNLIVKRGQEIQFGEKGTIGEFYLKQNPTPYETQLAYSKEFVTYLDLPLFDESNVDEEQNSLYYYFSNAEIYKNIPIVLNFQRKSNFYSLDYELFFDEKSKLKGTFKIKGNDAKENKIVIPRHVFQEEGVYTMQFQTSNFANNKSTASSMKFFVYNTKPETPVVSIPSQDLYIGKEKMIVNKKYFRIEVTNNGKSKSYAGWKYKEVHFFFKNKFGTSVYNSFPDYVVQANKTDGKILLRNTVSIENSEYDCKVIAYDYSGNASDPYEFSFEVISEISIEPEKLFTNELEKTDFVWTIQKSEDSDGFYYFLSYSSDGVTYDETETPIKVDSKYYLSDSNTKRKYELKLSWLKNNLENVKVGFYKLVCYEWSYKHPNGLSNYKFYSKPVEVNKIGNASEPIFAKNLEGTVRVFNQKQENEYVYTSDMDKIVFTTIHNESTLDDGSEKPDEQIVGQFYKIKLLEPGTSNEYQCRLPIPTKIGEYSFTEIAKKCNIHDQKEGVWELRFITRDRLGNINEKNGYYTYYIVVTKRSPVINSIVHANGTGSEYFGLNASEIAFDINETTYQDIENYHEHRDKFKFDKVIVNYLSNPQNVLQKMEIPIFRKTDIISVKVRDNLTEVNKKQHDLDGRYILTFQLVDPLGRKSELIEKTYYISTKISYDLLFLTQERFITNNVKIVASISDNVKNIYYKFVEEYEIDELKKADYKTFTQFPVQKLEYDTKQIYGFETEEKTFESNGNKYLCYFVEEKSGNVSSLQTYKFMVDTTAQFIPIFDSANKVYYTPRDNMVTITWNNTHKDVTQFYAKLNKIKLENGEYVIEKEYRINVLDKEILLEVSQEQNAFIDIKDRRFFNFLLQDGGIFESGHYMLTIKGVSKYGTSLENNFKFQINKASVILREIKKTTITVENNIITWTDLDSAEHYEISYDGKNFASTKFNFFVIDPNQLVEDKNNGKKYLYLRYKTYHDVFSTTTRVEITVDIKRLQKPEIIKDVSVITDTSFDGWNVIVKDPLDAKYIYYSFDNKNWQTQEVSGTTNKIIKDGVKPFPDGIYDIFLYTTDRLVTSEIPYNKSETVHSFVEVFAEPIPIPTLNIKNTEMINFPKNLYILDKLPNVDYYIFVNKRKVNEGFELSSGNQSIFKIDVKAIKKGTKELVNLITDFEVTVYTPNTYIIRINDEELLCNVNAKANVLEIIQMPNKKDNQVIMYKEKDNFLENWQVVHINDTLSLEKEWEFKIVTFHIV